MKRWFTLFLLFAVLLSASYSDTVWSDTQMDELQALVQQADNLITTQAQQLNELSAQLTILSEQTSRQQKSLKRWKTLSTVLGGTTLATLTILTINKLVD